MSRHAIEARERPYRAEHEAAIVARMDTGVRPSTLRALLKWYEQAVSDEMPDKLHSPGVWRDWGPQSVGGSALGSPRHSDAFRQYIEGSESATDQDGSYQTPVRAALWYLAEKSRRPLAARRLFRLAQCGFDWHRAADVLCLAHEDAEDLFTRGLERLWDAYCPSPPLSVRRDAVQEHAS